LHADRDNGLQSLLTRAERGLHCRGQCMLTEENFAGLL
jgi:hypothetical protein